MPATVVTFANTPTDFGKMNGSKDDFVYETVRRMSEELNRQKLTDVAEGDEGAEDIEIYPVGTRFLEWSPRRGSYSRDRRSSSASIASNTSLDTLWELHPRRLSEAGLRRTSDASIVLTEDTDSFMIGQRVWVGGSKPGQIAYIGETQFAPGEWAGVVLDEPIGKNDGSVAGTRYFQCEPRRGVFSRLTRLTRYPLPQGNTTPTPPATSTPSVMSKSTRRSLSPTGSTYSSYSTASTAATGSALRIGDRVIVRSSATTGSKAGTLRFVGETQFATGQWAGVELDDPIGKNDGSVDGMRYFDCKQFYGLFAPLSKVSKSPSKRRPSGLPCVVHSTGIRRTGSRESLNSTTASMVSNASSRRMSTQNPSAVKTTPNAFSTKAALQDALRARDAQVAQLLRDRQLDRMEVTKAAEQADHAEQLLAIMTKDFDKYRKECEFHLSEKEGALCQVKNEKDALVTQVEEEKRKVEDLSFKFEEAAINKGDVETHLVDYKRKLHEIKDTHKEELAKLKHQIEERDNDLSNMRVSLDKAYLELERKTEDVCNNAKKQEIELQKELNSIKDALKISQDNLKQKDAVINEITTKLEDTQRELQNKDEDIERHKRSKREADEQHAAEIQQAVEALRVARDTHFNEKSELEEKLTEKEHDLSSAAREVREAHFQSITKTITSPLTVECSAWKTTVQEKNNKISEFAAKFEAKCHELSECHDANSKLQHLVNHQKSQIETFKTETEALINKLKEQEDLQCDLTSKIHKLEGEIVDLKHNNDVCQTTITTHVQEINRVTLRLQSLEQEGQNSEGKIKDLVGQLSRMDGDIHNCKTEYSKEKADILKKHETLMMQVEIDKKKLQEMNNNLQKELASIGDQLQQAQQDAHKCNNEQRMTVQALRDETDARSKEGEDLKQVQEALTECKNTEVTLKVQINDLEGRLSTLAEQCHRQVKSITEQYKHAQDMLKQKDGEVQNCRKNCHDQLEKESQKFELLKKECSSKMQSMSEQLNEEASKRSQCEKQFAEQREENNKLKQDNLSCQHTLNIQTQTITKLETDLNKLKQDYNNAQKKLADQEDEIQKCKNDNNEISSKLQSAISQIASLQKAISGSERENAALKKAIAKLESTINEYEAKIKHMESEMSKCADEEKYCNSLKNDLEAMKSKHTAATERVDSLESIVSRLKGEISKLKVALDTEKRNLGSCERKLEENETQLKEAINKLRVGDQINNELKHKLELALKRLSEAESKVALLEQTIRKMRDELTESENKQCELEQKQKLLLNKISDLEAEILQLKKECEIKVLELNDVIKKLSIELDDWKNRSCDNEINKFLSKYGINKSEISSIPDMFKKLEECLTEKSKIQPGAVSHLHDSDDGIGEVQLLQKEKELLLQQLESLRCEMEEQSRELMICKSKTAYGVHKSDYDSAEFFKSLGLPDSFEVFKPRVQAPRKFCDICDKFDDHETEDCPFQRNDSPPPPQHVHHHRPKQVENFSRPYCDICEAFGHSTENCDENETF